MADLVVLRLNGALLNVIRTNATDINVTSAVTTAAAAADAGAGAGGAGGRAAGAGGGGGGGVQQYVQGLDYEVVAPATPNVEYDPRFYEMYQQPQGAAALAPRFQIKRLAGGAIAAAEEVLVSYDFGTNMVGDMKPNYPRALGDPLYYAECKASRNPPWQPRINPP